ncbi:PEP-CTERM/exosortase system-associated acyltransferase [Ningiella sp. W23]|uniref:PEP-CTERM/exosortase system-associated acyltransferase n=1 Tax=Ningiella sp. W23 TaxID=3023715 RepID=UPI00375652A6
MNTYAQRQIFENGARRLVQKISIPFQKVWIPFSKLSEAKSIVNSFNDYFSCHVATTRAQVEQTLALRKEVYVSELNIIKESHESLEEDRFDNRSYHCFIQHRKTGLMVGSVRLITLESEQDDLQLSSTFKGTYTKQKLSPDAHSFQKVCEISRLTVPPIFRRKAIKELVENGRMDTPKEYYDYRYHMMNSHHFSEIELKCFSFVAISLYFCAGSMAVHLNKPKVYVAVKPQLAKNMKYVGINFKKIGPMRDILGMRSPYYVDALQFRQRMFKTYKVLFEQQHEQLSKHIKKLKSYSF